MNEVNRRIPTTRTNAEWLLALSDPHHPQPEALTELRDLLLRAALFTLVTHLPDLRELEEAERMAMAEDCAQDAIQAVLARLPEFRGESKFTTWAYKFGINMALTRARRESWKHVSLDAFPDSDDPLEWLPGKAADSEQSSLQAEVSRVIGEVVRSELTSRQRQVLKWIAFDGVPMDVVVERLASNRNAIYKLLHDARLKIKQHLSARGYEVGEVYDLFRMGQGGPIR